MPTIIVSLRCFEGLFRSLKFSNGLSKLSRASLHNNHQNTLKPCFMTASVFRWNSCGLRKCLSGQQGRTLQKIQLTILLQIRFRSSLSDVEVDFDVDPDASSSIDRSPYKACFIFAYLWNRCLSTWGCRFSNDIHWQLQKISFPNVYQCISLLLDRTQTMVLKKLTRVPVASIFRFKVCFWILFIPWSSRLKLLSNYLVKKIAKLCVYGRI